MFRKVQNPVQNFTHLGIERDTGFHVAKLLGRSQTLDISEARSAVAERA